MTNPTTYEKLTSWQRQAKNFQSKNSSTEVKRKIKTGKYLCGETGQNQENFDPRNETKTKVKADLKNHFENTSDNDKQNFQNISQ